MNSGQQLFYSLLSLLVPEALAPFYNLLTACMRRAFEHSALLVFRSEMGVA